MGLCCFKSPSNKVHVADAKKQPVVAEQPSSKHVEAEWDYINCENWSKHYPEAKKSHQSPIDIKTSEAIYNWDLEKSPIQLKYETSSFTEITNNGHTFVVSGPGQDSLASGCGLTNAYRLAQFHMHWGPTDETGSEHLVDGISYAAELHFVHWNYFKYPSVKEAVASGNHDGLLVLGILISVGEENPEFEKLCNVVEEIKLKGRKTSLAGDFDARKLFPADLSKYWTYPGSLTTPPCNQSVKWVVFYQPIQVSSRQLNKFRNLHMCSDSSQCCDSSRLVKNYRPVCKLNQRKILKSFK